jgi:hypothetical protein
MYVFLVLLTAVACGVLCHYVASRRGGNAILWAALGLFFGPLAIPFVFLSGSRR